MRNELGCDEADTIDDLAASQNKAASTTERHAHLRNRPSTICMPTLALVRWFAGATRYRLSNAMSIRMTSIEPDRREHAARFDNPATAYAVRRDAS